VKTASPALDGRARRRKQAPPPVGVRLEKATPQDKHIGIFRFLSWAHFRPKAPETGLSVPIPQLFQRKSLRYFRFYPLRVPAGAFFRHYDSGKQAVYISMRLSWRLGLVKTRFAEPSEISEHTNGLIRQYLPKKIPFDTLTQKQTLHKNSLTKSSIKLFKKITRKQFLPCGFFGYFLQ
jgi:hypothetical protein